MDKCEECKAEPSIVSTEINGAWMDLCDDCFGNSKSKPVTAEQPTKAEVKGSANGAEGKTMKTKKTKKATPKTDHLKTIRVKAAEETKSKPPFRIGSLGYVTDEPTKPDLLDEMKTAKALGKPVKEIRESKKLLAENTAMDSKEKAKKPSKKKEAVKKSAPAKKTEAKKDEPEIKGEPLKESDGFKFDGRVEYIAGQMSTQQARKIAPWAKAFSWRREGNKYVGALAFASLKDHHGFKEHKKSAKKAA